MLTNLKYGSIIKLLNKIYMIKNIEYIDDIIKITLKNMEPGRITEELFTEKMLKTFPFKQIDLRYTHKHERIYYFIDAETKEEFTYSDAFIGSDFPYLKGEAKREFKATVCPVKTNVYWDNIKPDSLITLSCETENADIYYTTDGSVPDETCEKYISPIIPKNGMILRTIACLNGYDPSPTTRFDIHQRHRQIKIFLSPSRQKYNVGHENSPFTTEMEEMNKICDLIEKRLLDYDVIVLRNNPQTFIEDWVEEGKKPALMFI